jgi:hypothetical protein
MPKSFRKYLSNITGKTWNDGDTENSHTGHCTYSVSPNVKIQDTQLGK